MINNIVIFEGSKRDFEEYVGKNISNYDGIVSFMRVVQQYNVMIRNNEFAVGEEIKNRKVWIENIVVRADDFASVTEHALSNFLNIIELNNDVDSIYIHNPPRRVIESLSEYEKNIVYEKSKYKKINRGTLKTIYNKLGRDVLGQEECKKELISGLYRMIVHKTDKPMVVLLYGPSGVGKTETAKSISEVLGGSLLRIQFSMMQTTEAYNYVFGSEHAKSSFAKDMLSRETNVILIDEFDKVNEVFYNAFYQVFDEGEYVDTNYKVDLKNTIFICTSNFKDEEDIRKSLGPAMFSRIGNCIEYTELNRLQKEIIVEQYYGEILSSLNKDEKEYIISTNILQWFKDNIDRFNNIRLLKSRIENAVFKELTDRIIH